MQLIKISDLAVHPKNSFFFDDISGEPWDEFLKSVQTSGIIEPIVITQDKVIVSGHQRVRACKELGVREINAEIRIFNNEDEILKCLIETNLRQRGIGNTNSVKLGRCVKELERIYGIRNGSFNKKGNNRIGEPNNSGDQMTQEDMASQLEISTDTLRNYKRLAEMIPEMQELVMTGIVKPTTALAVIKQLPESEQRELAASWIEEGKKITKSEAEKKISELKLEIIELKKNPVEVTPPDYAAMKSEVESLRRDRDDRDRKIRELQLEIKSMNAVHSPYMAACEGSNEVYAVIEAGYEFIDKLNHLKYNTAFRRTNDSDTVGSTFDEFCKAMTDCITDMIRARKPAEVVEVDGNVDVEDIINETADIVIY